MSFGSQVEAMKQRPTPRDPYAFGAYLLDKEAKSAKGGSEVVRKDEMLSYIDYAEDRKPLERWQREAEILTNFQSMAERDPELRDFVDTLQAGWTNSLMLTRAMGGGLLRLSGAIASNYALDEGYKIWDEYEQAQAQQQQPNQNPIQKLVGSIFRGRGGSQGRGGGGGQQMPTNVPRGTGGGFFAQPQRR